MESVAGQVRKETEEAVECMANKDATTTLEKTMGETTELPKSMNIRDSKPHPLTGSITGETGHTPALFTNQLPPPVSFSGEISPDTKSVDEWL